MKKILPIFLTAAAMAWAASSTVGTDPLALFKAEFGPRAAAMGGAYTGFAEDVTGIWWNPAGIDQDSTGDLLLGYHRWFTGISHNYVGVVYPTSFRTTVGGGAIVSIVPGIDKYDDQGVPQGTASSQTGIVQFNYARRLIDKKLSVGFGVKGIFENLIDNWGQGGAVDLGIHYRPAPIISLGLAVQNAGVVFYPSGPKMPSPALRTGVALHLLKFFTLAGDFNLPKDMAWSGHLGMEFSVFNILFLRGGYQTGPWSLADAGMTGVTTDMEGLSGGLGVKWQNLRVDYVYTPFGPTFGPVHRFALGLTFGSRAKKEGSVKGRIYDSETGKPVAATIIFAHTKILRDTGTVHFDAATPVYHLDKLTIGEYRITLKPDDPHYPAQDITLVVRPAETITQDFALTHDREEIVLSDIYFDTGKSQLRDEFAPTLEQVAKLLDNNPKLVLEIAGHADPRQIMDSSYTSNWWLASGRTKTIKKYLVEKYNIDPLRLVTKVYAENDPIVSNRTPAGMEINRRVEIRLLWGSEYYQVFKYVHKEVK
jgi:outer membrane protein OmpA-like peptidoglycan-associated protein